MSDPVNMKVQLQQLRVGFTNATPMVKGLVGGVVAPLFDLLEQLIVRVEQLERRDG